MSNGAKGAAVAGGGLAAALGFMVRSVDDVARAGASGVDDIVRVAARSADDVAGAGAAARGGAFADDLGRPGAFGAGASDDLAFGAAASGVESEGVALPRQLRVTPSGRIVIDPKLRPRSAAPEALSAEQRAAILDDVAHRNELVREAALEATDLGLDLASDRIEGTSPRAAIDEEVAATATALVLPTSASEFGSLYGRAPVDGELAALSALASEETFSLGTASDVQRFLHRAEASGARRVTIVAPLERSPDPRIRFADHTHVRLKSLEHRAHAFGLRVLVVAPPVAAPGEAARAFEEAIQAAASR